MGHFKIEINAVGGHGCQREIKDGGEVWGCGKISCPDCAVRYFLSWFKFTTGSTINSATLTHWPGGPGEVVDDLVTRKRKGNF